MVSFTFKVKDTLGIHARAAGILVQEALKCSGDVTIRKGDRQGNAKLIFHVMTLNIRAGDEVEILVSGEKEDEEAAMLKAFYQEQL